MIVDDSDSFRDLLRLQLGSERTTVAASIAEGLELAREQQPSVILLDNWFARRAQTGIDAIPLFRRAAPGASIFILTADEDLVDVARAIHAGARGYVTKGSTDDLWEALLAASDISPIRPPVEAREATARPARRVH